jgi:sulfur-oxidizing protein SoxY
MEIRRRNLLKAAATAGALLVAGLLRPVAALAAWSKEAFGAKNLADAMKSLGATGAAPSAEIAIEAPQIAENGSVVPIEITSKLAGTTAIAVLIEKNPFPLAGKFNFSEGALPYAKLNVKMGETSEIRVIAWAGGKAYSAHQEVKVTIGGCGG